jgi:hypothetical protein
MTDEKGTTCTSVMLAGSKLTVKHGEVEFTTFIPPESMDALAVMFAATQTRQVVNVAAMNVQPDFQEFLAQAIQFTNTPVKAC